MRSLELTDLEAQDPLTGPWVDTLRRVQATVHEVPLAKTYGRITRLAGLIMEARGISLPLGAACQVGVLDGRSAEAEVVGFEGDRLFLMPLGSMDGIQPGASVQAVPGDEPQGARRLPLGSALLGRVLDATGRPLDRLGPLANETAGSLQTESINPLERPPIRQSLDVGVRAINALLTVGRGQRLGLFAGSGVGKSVLLGMMARYTTADVIVVGLIGERGREVKEFIEDILGAQGMARSVVVAAPADVSPLLRIQGAAYATRIAEHFRDEGKQVLLIMDSLTRTAMAQREIALSIGEPPATKGYPPSVFAKLPALVERAGTHANGGSITAFYTVLAEGDDQQDPIADAARAILDGHIVLSRALAEAGHYPAIDIEQSISRVMPALVDSEQLSMAQRLKSLVSRYQRSRDLIAVGAYSAGSDPELDEAIRAKDAIRDLLMQGMHEQADMDQSCGQLRALFRPSNP